MALVVKSWKVTSNPAPGEPNVAIVARDSGLASFVLSIVGIDATATLRISSRHVFYEEGSLAGFTRRIVPLEHVACTYYGRVKPWKQTSWLLVGSIGLGVWVGGAVGMLVFLVGSALSLATYFFYRTLTIGVVPVSGEPRIELSFNRSVIEGQEIDDKAAENVIRVIEHLIKPTEGVPLGDLSLGSPAATGAMAAAAPQSLAEVGRNLGLGSPRASPTAPPAAVAASAAVRSNACPKCGTAVTRDEVFCGICGHKVR
jgi:hypothetical protein